MDPVLDWFATHRELTPTTPPLADELVLHFDWVQAVTNQCVTFCTTILRGSVRSEIQFEISLSRLDTDKLAQLHSVLSRRHAGLDNGPEVAGSVAWLLGLSLQQTSNLGLPERAASVRQLLLVQ